MMKRFDANSDGTLDATEQKAAQAFREERRQKRMAGPEGQSWGQGMRGNPSGTPGTPPGPQ